MKLSCGNSRVQFTQRVERCFGSGLTDLTRHIGRDFVSGLTDLIRYIRRDSDLSFRRSFFSTNLVVKGMFLK